MWIFLSDAFLSIVDKGGDGSTLLVRARKSEDIKQVFPDADVSKGGGTDTCTAHASTASRWHNASQMLSDKPPTNFKSSVKERRRHDAYMRVWDAMYEFQEGVA